MTTKPCAICWTGQIRTIRPDCGRWSAISLGHELLQIKNITQLKCATEGRRYVADCFRQLSVTVIIATFREKRRSHRKHSSFSSVDKFGPMDMIA